MGQQQRQLSEHAERIRDAIRQIEHECEALDIIVLRTPTGCIRESITGGLILIKSGISDLKDVV